MLFVFLLCFNHQVCWSEDLSLLQCLTDNGHSCTSCRNTFQCDLNNSLLYSCVVAPCELSNSLSQAAPICFFVMHLRGKCLLRDHTVCMSKNSMHPACAAFPDNETTGRLAAAVQYTMTGKRCRRFNHQSCVTRCYHAYSKGSVLMQLQVWSSSAQWWNIHHLLRTFPHYKSPIMSCTPLTSTTQPGSPGVLTASKQTRS